MRLRKLEVEYRKCSCGRDVFAFESELTCRFCHQPFTENTPRRTRALLGIDGADRPWYTRQERCACPSCSTSANPALFALSIETLAQAREGLARGDVLDDMASSSDETHSVPVMHRGAQAIDRARARLELNAFCWCPRCRTEGVGDGRLPRRPTWVYVPVKASVVHYEQDGAAIVLYRPECIDQFSVDYSDDGLDDYPL